MNLTIISVADLVISNFFLVISIFAYIRIPVYRDKALNILKRSITNRNHRIHKKEVTHTKVTTMTVYYLNTRTNDLQIKIIDKIFK